MGAQETCKFVLDLSFDARLSHATTLSVAFLLRPSALAVTKRHASLQLYWRSQGMSRSALLVCPSTEHESCFLIDLSHQGFVELMTWWDQRKRHKESVCVCGVCGSENKGGEEQDTRGIRSQCSILQTHCLAGKKERKCAQRKPLLLPERI